MPLSAALGLDILQPEQETEVGISIFVHLLLGLKPQEAVVVMLATIILCCTIFQLIVLYIYFTHLIFL